MFATTTRGLFAICLLMGLAVVPVRAAGTHPAVQTKCGKTKPTTGHKLRPASSSPAIVFGVTGGNIVPWSISIDGDGNVTSNGWFKAKNAHLNGARDALAALFKLADAEGFWSMQSFTNCAGTLPDITSQYVEIASTTGTKRVTIHGGCIANFNQLVSALENAVDAQR